MGLLNFIVPWILYLTLPREWTSVGLWHQNLIQDHHKELTVSSTARDDSDHSTVIVQTPLQNSPQTNLVWTDFMTEGQFGWFRFGIGITSDFSTNMNEATSSPMHISGTEKLFVTVTAETNKSDVRLAITSCKHMSDNNKAKSYFIQDGCSDNRMVENITREDNKIVFTLHLPGLAQISGSSPVFISCGVKLCLNSNHSESCGFYCPLQLFSKQPSESILETRTYHITSQPIYVIWEPRNNAPRNYVVMVIGTVLGVTVLAVVVLLVSKSFYGIRRRNILMDL